MTQTTKVDVYLKNPTGTPMTNTRFTVKPVRAGFWSDRVGLVEDKELLFSTDENGYIQIPLWPLPYPYIMTYSYDDDAIPGHFLFYVPAIDTPVNLQDLIVTRADSNDKYIDTVLAQIIAAKIATLAAAAEAAKAAAAAKASEDASATSETNAETAATEAAASYNAMLVNQTNIQNIYTQLLECITKIQAINLTNMLKLGGYTLWVDSSGRLRIMNGVPTDKDTDGTVVGTQS